MKIWSLGGWEKCIVLLLTKNLVCIQIKPKLGAAVPSQIPRSSQGEIATSQSVSLVAFVKLWGGVLHVVKHDSRLVTIPIMLKKGKGMKNWKAKSKLPSKAKCWCQDFGRVSLLDYNHFKGNVASFPNLIFSKKQTEAEELALIFLLLGLKVQEGAV